LFNNNSENSTVIHPAPQENMDMYPWRNVSINMKGNNPDTAGVRSWSWIHRSGAKMRYPVVLPAMGICLLFCLTASARSKKNAAPAADPVAVSGVAVSTPTAAVPENPPAPVQAVPENTTANPSPVQQEIDSLQETKPAGSLDRPQVAQEQPEATPVQEDKTAPNFQVYKVWLWQESRDCLWNIAKKYYGDPWQWKKIYLANKLQIDNPNKIYPRQSLVIPPKDEPEQ
jgi:nucleoid-associated protein YgaU